MDNKCYRPILPDHLWCNDGCTGTFCGVVEELLSEEYRKIYRAQVTKEIEHG